MNAPPHGQANVATAAQTGYVDKAQVDAKKTGKGTTGSATTGHSAHPAKQLK